MNGQVVSCEFAQGFRQNIARVSRGMKPHMPRRKITPWSC